mmetsp:Transcript_22303/g.56821  ORF Transcript_22303/g.56821 Transcript_22303/m.56821 type:complete len:116 (+) Transcript_22303:227-574(+)
MQGAAQLVPEVPLPAFWLHPLLYCLQHSAASSGDPETEPSTLSSHWPGGGGNPSVVDDTPSIVDGNPVVGGAAEPLATAVAEVEPTSPPENPKMTATAPTIPTKTKAAIHTFFSL